MPALVRSKLVPDAAPDFAVLRPRLARRLDAAWDRKLTSIAAPAGYGKSVLLSQWYAGGGDNLAWLSVDARDRDPVRMGGHLLESLDDAVPGIAKRARASLGPPAVGLGDAVVDLLLEDLGGLATDLVVVLEDVDHLDGQPAADDVARLMVEAPPNIHFVVASRREPPVPIHLLRTSGTLLELGTDDLRFEVDEAAALVKALSGHELSEPTASHLVQITEGWPVAVQLAALALRDGADEEVIARFGATDRGIFQYLSAELLGRLPAELSSFLLDVSVLAELEPGVCDRATGRDDSAELLGRLRTDAVFVVPLARDSGRLRLHRLVRDFLNQELIRANPARFVVLNERAAAWYLERDEPGQAAEHLIAARSWEALTDLIARYGRSKWDRGEVETVLGWMQALPQAVRRAHTQLRLTEASLHLLSGRPESSASLLTALERDGGLTPGQQVTVDVFMCAQGEAANPHPEMLLRQGRSLAALASLAPADAPDVFEATDPASLTCLLRFSGAKIRLLLGVSGAFDDAQAATEAPPSTAANFLVQAFGTRALIQALANRGAASADARRALSLAEQHLAPDTSARIPAEVALAVAARNGDDLDRAEDLAEVALAHAIRWRRWPMVGFVIGEGALVELARGAPTAALAWLDRATELGAPLAPLVSGRFLAIERRAHAALGDSPGSRRSAGSRASWELLLAEIALAVQAGDVARAQRQLDEWPTTWSPLGDLERQVGKAIVDQARGAGPLARATVIDVLAVTARERVVSPFVAAGSTAIPLVADASLRHPNTHTQHVLAAMRRAAGQSPDLIEPLTDREVDLLRLLPTRMTNAELATTLVVSTNTVKTHLKHIYQKLGAIDRNDAIARAQELRLL